MGNWRAETVRKAREEESGTLPAIMTTVLDRVARKRHVLIEQSLGSQVYDEPEMNPIRDLIDEGILFDIRSDGCALGYCDAESGLPNYKPKRFLTSSVVLPEALRTHMCPGNHVQQHLQSRISYRIRTLLAAKWPH